jgi:hypothetical protein
MEAAKQDLRHADLAIAWSSQLLPWNRYRTRFTVPVELSRSM